LRKLLAKLGWISDDEPAGGAARWRGLFEKRAKRSRTMPEADIAAQLGIDVDGDFGGVNNSNPAEEFAVNFDVSLCELALLDKDAAVAAIRGEDDFGRAVSVVPLEAHFEGEESPALSGIFARLNEAARERSIVARVFREPVDILRRERWCELADRLEDEGDLDGAIQALDNCLTIGRLYPYHGDPDLRPEWSWAVDRGVFERMLPLVDKRSDRFDAMYLARQIAVLDEWDA
jgi:hypothetical protein